VRLVARLDEVVGRPRIAAALLLLLFPYRLAFGLTVEFWFIDELQIYLIEQRPFGRGAHQERPERRDSLPAPGFLFTVREPWALTFYLVFPMSFLYSLFCYAPYLGRPRWQAVAAIAARDYRLLGERRAGTFY
jgi:hypothetical protein